MKKSLRPQSVGLILLASIGLPACVPFPHTEVIAPDVTGVLTKDGLPQPNIKVNYMYSHKPATLGCEPASATTTTNNAGEFYFDQAKKFLLYIQLEQGHDWKLCFQTDDTLVLGTSSGGLGPSAKRLNISCDLANDTVEGICNHNPLSSMRPQNPFDVKSK